MEDHYIGYIEQEDLPPIPPQINKMAARTLIKQLQNGKLPWQKPWTGHDDKEMALPRYPDYGSYRGINVLLLWASTINHGFTSSQWDTRAEWHKQKEKICKGEKGTKVIYFDKDETGPNGEETPVYSTKTKTVFNRCQLDNHQPKTPEPYFSKRMDLVENNVDKFINNLVFEYEITNSNHDYDYRRDMVKIALGYVSPGDKHCSKMEAYFSGLFSCLIKWSGHPERLNRQTYNDNNQTAENLIAEIGSAFICTNFRIAALDKCDDKNRLDGWIKAIKENENDIVVLANEAAKASEYLFTLQPMQ